MLYCSPDTVKGVLYWYNLSLTTIPCGRKRKQSVKISIMRTRPIVLTNETARHPFRRQLPVHVLEVKGVVGAKAEDAASDDNDWKLFVLSFCAFFTAFYSFIF